MSELTATRPPPPLDLLPRTRARRGSLRVSERRIVLMLGDLLMISVALLAALGLRLPWLASQYGNLHGLFVMELRWWLVLWTLWIPSSITAACYDLRAARSVARSLPRTAGCALAVAIIYLLIPRVSAPLTYSRLSWFLFAFLAVGGVTAWRVFYALALSQRSLTRRTLIVGAGATGRALARTVDSAGAGGIDLVAFIDDDPALWGQQVMGRPVWAGSDHLLALAVEHQVDEVVVAISDVHRIRPPLLAALVRCWEQGIPVIPMSVYYEQVARAVPVEHLGPNLLALVDRQEDPLVRVWLVVRRLMDVVVGGAGLLFLLPAFPIIAVAIALDSPGPILYRQVRVGRGGRMFRIVKFRSMVANAEPNGAAWADPADPRVTRVGRLMRKTRIDELPQFWNVLWGDMTLIGPRPERPEFVQDLDGLLPYYAVRHSLKPGITGWAQVNYHYGSSVDDALTKLQYDLYYVKHRGPGLDALIALYTIRVMVTLQGV